MNVSQNWEQESNKGIEDRKRGIRKKHKVYIIGDSHARGCAAEVTHNLGETFEVTGYVMPGTGLEVITKIANREIDKLTKEDVVVVWGGANDVGKNASNDGLKHISNFVKYRSYTNIVMLNAPHRYDLETSSCVNNEVQAFNRKLFKTMKMFEHTKIIEVNLNREHFTRHGLHMNAAGKELIAQRIANNIRGVLTRQTTTPISMTWKEDLTEFSQEENEVEERSDGVLDWKVPELRSSERHRKQPVTRSDDFLWTVGRTKKGYL